MKQCTNIQLRRRPPLLPFRKVEALVHGAIALLLIAIAAWVGGGASLSQELLDKQAEGGLSPRIAHQY